jgi:hypothetical protein
MRNKYLWLLAGLSPMNVPNVVSENQSLQWSFFVMLSISIVRLGGSFRFDIL